MTTLTSYRNNVYTLTQVGTGEFPPTFVNALVLDAVREIYRKHGTGWGFALTIPTESVGVAFEDQFDPIVQYTAAARLLKIVNDSTPRADQYLQWAAAVMADMEKYYLSANANPGSINGIQTLTGLSDSVRAVTGVYDPQVLSFDMLRELINVAYTEIINYRAWNNWRSYWQDPLPAWTLAADTGYAVNAHQLVLNANVFGHLPGAGSGSGIRGEVVKEAYLVTGGANGRQQRMIRTDSLADIPEGSEQVYYTVETYHEGTETRMLIAPEQETNGTFVRWVSNDPVTRIDTYYDEEEEVLVSTFFEVPPQFNMLLVYRAAQLVLQQVAPEDPRIEAYGTTFASLLDAFVTFDQLNHDTQTFSIGQQGKDKPRYAPWFKPA